MQGEGAPAKEVWVTAVLQARREAAVGVSNRGRGGFPWWRARRRDETAAAIWGRCVARGGRACRGERWYQGEAGRPGGAATAVQDSLWAGKPAAAVAQQSSGEAGARR